MKLRLKSNTNNMSRELTVIALDKMSDSKLSNYILSQIEDWPVKLTKGEKDALYTTMWNSVVTMKLKQMSQAERDEYYAQKRLEAKIEQEVKTQVKERKNRLKTHHLYV